MHSTPFQHSFYSLKHGEGESMDKSSFKSSFRHCGGLISALLSLLLLRNILWCQTVNKLQQKQTKSAIKLAVFVTPAQLYLRHLSSSQARKSSFYPVISGIVWVLVLLLFSAFFVVVCQTGEERGKQFIKNWQQVELVSRDPALISPISCSADN